MGMAHGNIRPVTRKLATNGSPRTKPQTKTPNQNSDTKLQAKPTETEFERVTRTVTPCEQSAMT